MRKGVVILLMLFFGAGLLQAESHLMRFADVSHDYIVFTYENDLWLAPITGGKAKRITRSDGREIFAKFSPDGSKIAFTANYDGGNDVYVMNRDGSEPRRLTFHPASDLVIDWYPDGKHILFRSRREWPYRADKLYKISIDGGMPEKVNVDRAGLAALSPDGKKLAYNRISREFRNWKRYEGGMAQDIWVGTMARGDYRPITRFRGTDNFPMWHESGLYFTSDSIDGTMNLYHYDFKTKQFTQLTHYNDYDVKYPSLGPDHIIFQYAESLYLLDLNTRQIKPVPIEMPSDRTLVREFLLEKPENYVYTFALSPKGKRALLNIRGEIVNMPTDEGVTYHLTPNSSDSREKNAIWSPDGQWIAFFSDKTGEEELYLVRPTGGKWKQITKNGFAFRTNPKWSPNSKYIIFHDKFMRLNLVDVATGKITVVDQGEYDDAWYDWGIQTYNWSPDSRWIAYSKLEQSLYPSIFLYNVETGERFRVTDSFTKDWSPSFSPDGKYLYFLSNRTFKPIMGFVDQNHIFLNMTRPYILILKKGDPSPFAPKNDWDDEDADESESRADNVVITTEDFAARIIPAPVKAGNLFRLEAIDDGLLYLKKTENEFLKYQFVDDENRATNLELHRFSLKDQKDETLMEGIGQYHLSADKKRLIYRAGTRFGVVDLGKAKVGDGALNFKDVTLIIDKLDEFKQIFAEAWRIQRDWFYDKNMHGLNWQKVRESYEKFVPLCGTRGDLNYLIGEMIAELNAGHTYVYGGDLEHGKSVRCGLLGADFVMENGFPKIARIVHGDNSSEALSSPFEQPGCPIKVGDYILGIDGLKLKKNANLYQYLQNKAGKVVEILYNNSPTVEGAKTYLVKTLNSEYQLRYDEWVQKNAAYVEAKSKGQIGYVHLPNMMEDGLIQFAKRFYPQYYKKAIIIDARYNGGGFTSKMIHDRLERTINSYVQPREGKPTPVPERTFGGHMALIINRDTGSDGELFSEAWKYRYKDRPIIGQRTWGGAVGIEPHQKLVDGGVTTPPQFGEYNAKGEWIIEGHGVDPTIPVVNWPKDVLAGKDAQLDKTIDVLLKMIKEKPVREFPRPKYPDKSKPAWK
ncbi:peptidase S41 [Caldithrix abyssi DSM 13497]|uniref:Tricorn protease homolog n=1 Tax=Caldithrix abyssi DSM 13497 TaxID=880073 RepID=H1XQM3_CALAY|nr:S41 family peptidase [Caldithrix abyssi]APF17016.1 tricorn protease [Caldithrix abyssi DSM 13497]EHO41169.1 peptidase S41 [Caldithrix abyssi DSM 13497]